MNIKRRHSPSGSAGPTYYVGWDVGAWHSDKKDGIVILKKEYNELQLAAKPFLGNIAKEFKNKTLVSWIYDQINPDDNFILAIDAILGCPQDALNIWDISKNDFAEISPDLDNGAQRNSYLYRYIEMQLADKPLSLVQDLMGSQSTKALFALKQSGAKWCNDKSDSDFGVWVHGKNKFIETYPANARKFISQEVESIKLKIENSSIRENSDVLACSPEHSSCREILILKRSSGMSLVFTLTLRSVHWSFVATRKVKFRHWSERNRDCLWALVTFALKPTIITVMAQPLSLPH